MMSIFILYILALIIPLIILFVFSIMIITSALNKKNIKLDLFAFNFDFGKLRQKIGNTGHSTDDLPVLSTKAEHAGEQTEDLDAATERIVHAVQMINSDGDDDGEPQEEADEADCLESIADFGDLSAFEDIDMPAEEEHTLTSGLKKRFARAQQDAAARAIEREEKRIQDELEIYDPDEIPEEMPEDFRGRLKYWWRNHIGFRIGTCSLAAFLICVMVFYSFQLRSRTHEEQDIETSENTHKTDEKNSVSDDIDQSLNVFRQGLDTELLPIDIAANSLDADPDLAEIISTAQESVGETPASYIGSSTNTQPSGSIGTISIPSINLSNAPVMGSVDLSDLSKGTGHFENTPVFDGNVGIAGHNNTHFKYLVNVDIGDQIQYTVNGVTRTYQVTDMRAISDTDWGVFNDYGDNRLTLVTCEHLVPNSRIAVTAIQVGSDTGTVKTAAYTTGKNNTSYWQDSGDYHDAGSGYTDYIGVFTGNN